MDKIRVVLVGLGPIGIITLKEALRREAIEVAGGIDIDPALNGKDLGALAGGAACGKVVRADMEAALAEWKPAAALLTTVSQVDRVAPQVEALIRAGANIVSSSEELLLASHRAPDIAARLDKLAKEAGVTVVGAGVNPGFAMDLYPLVMSYMSRGVDRVSVWRRLDASLRRGPLQKKAGAGLTVEEFRAGEKEGWVGHKGLQESIALICQGLGWEPDKVVETLDPIIAKDPVRTGHYDVQPGQVGGIHHTGRAWKGERLLVEMDLKMIMGAEDTFDRVKIEGVPLLDVTVRGGILGDDATAAALMNTVPLAVKAPAGLLSPLELPLPRGVGE